ncbi:MAG TPA: PASTA domain-containing protein [Streptosporangiaceae bacterium]|nr:PASTA domain-containing protein [Streptosporangiaceae bacterium]
MDTALSPPVGQLLGGRYHVDSRIARGGMATVYLGTDTRLDRVVALKIAHPELSDDAEFVRRFIGEARSAARLSSPNVVAIFDQGSDKRLHYIAMEYVPGRTLRQLLNERGRLGAREALDIMSGVLTGLAAAHEAGFAHRDVKPENVLLTTSGAVKVADFGLARSVAGAVQTKGGMIIGTAAYLAPEQVSGGTSDARTDVYAAGIMLFELLTGAQPHTGESPLAVAYKHVNEVVPAPSSILPGLSTAVDALVAMATSRDPDLRPANAGQFLRAIQEVRDGQALPGTAPYQAPVGYGPGTTPHRGPAPYQGSGPQPGLPYHGSGPQPGLPYQGSGPQPGLSGSHPYQAQVSGPLAGPAGPGGLDGPDRMNGSVRAVGPFRLDDGTDGTRNLPPLDYEEPDGYSSPLPWEPQPGAVGASALPSLSPQTSDLLPAPHADSMVNHTLVVSDAGLLAAYDDLPAVRNDRSFDDVRYSGRRSAGQPREPWVQRYLFSHRLIYVSAGLAVVLVIALAGWWFSSGRYQKVPAVSGMTWQAAETVLTNQGLQFKLGKHAHNALPKGDVIKTLPAHGSRMADGSSVTLIVSLGPVMRMVPNVSGQPEAAAKAYLVQHHLKPGQDKPAVSSSVPAGDVIGTIPRAYTLIPQNQRVRLVVSEGPGLPSFLGMQVSDAQATAAAGGYTINAVPNAKGSEPANTITSQSPSPNTPITPGEVVTVHFSPGPPTVPVPDVQGMSIQQAILTLHRAGFRIAVSHSGPGGTVGSYSPTGNQPKGTVITLTTGIFSGL